MDDARFDRLEQILPTLATKMDLRGLESRTAAATTALRDELRVEIRESEQRSATLARVLHEELRSDIQMLAGHLADVMSRVRGR